ncbi:MAG: hypothetical protein K9M82_03630 [Deltaproteobacteria bacterium]|nr:hypothetical protein [Deltaproteobacteria bacterium]
MDVLDNAFLWIAAHFTPDAYLVSTKVQGLVWSGADLLLVFAFLRIADVLRAGQGAPPIRWRYVFLAATALLTPLLVFARSSRGILLLESLICGVQFLILVATLILERSRLLGLARRLGQRYGTGRE